MRIAVLLISLIFCFNAAANPLHDLANALDDLKNQLGQAAVSITQSKSKNQPDNVVTSISDQSDTNKIVESEGIGETPQLAKEDAIRNAVQKTVGSYVSSDLISQNDQVIKDKVVNLSSAFVEKVDVISQSKREDGLFQTRIRANVKSLKLKRAIDDENIKTVDLDSESLFGEALTKLDSSNNTLELWSAMLNKFPQSAVTAELAGKPALAALEGDQVVMTLSVKVSWDEKYHEEFINLAKLTGQITTDDSSTSYLSLGSHGESTKKLVIQDTNLNENIRSLVRNVVTSSKNSLSVNVELKTAGGEVAETVYGCLSPDFKYKRFSDNPFIHSNSIDLLGFNWKYWLAIGPDGYGLHDMKFGTRDQQKISNEATKPLVKIESLYGNHAFILKLKKVVSKSAILNINKADVVVTGCV